MKRGGAGVRGDRPAERGRAISVVALTGCESRRRRLCMSTIRADTSREAEPVSADRSRSLHVCRLPWGECGHPPATVRRTRWPGTADDVDQRLRRAHGRPLRCGLGHERRPGLGRRAQPRRRRLPTAIRRTHRCRPGAFSRLGERTRRPRGVCRAVRASLGGCLDGATRPPVGWFRSAGHARRAGRAVPACGSGASLSCDLRRARRRAFCGRVVGGHRRCRGLDVARRRRFPPAPLRRAARRRQSAVVAGRQRRRSGAVRLPQRSDRRVDGAASDSGPGVSGRVRPSGPAGPSPDRHRCRWVGKR